MSTSVHLPYPIIIINSPHMDETTRMNFDTQGVITQSARLTISSVMRDGFWQRLMIRGGHNRKKKMEYYYSMIIR